MTLEDIKVEKETRIAEMEKSISSVIYLLGIQTETLESLVTAAELLRERIERLEQGKNG
jgi:hypothetical protein